MHEQAETPEVDVKRVEQLRLGELYALWDRLGDTPTNDDDEIDAQFIHFPKGTPREEIWHWFESQNSAFVVGEVMSSNTRGQHHV
jgi:hypothetical protein